MPADFDTSERVGGPRERADQPEAEGRDPRRQLALHRRMLQRKAARDAAAGGTAAAGGRGVEGALAAAEQSGGAPADARVRSQVEATTGADLSDVRVHTGESSQAAAQALGARAYTAGPQLHFAAGQYQPGTADGDALLAHELVHAAQQQGAPAAGPQTKLAVSQPGDAAESEADSIAASALAGDGHRRAVTPAAGGSVQRKAAVDPLASDTRNPRDPKAFDSYEEWLHAFSNLQERFSARDTPNPAGGTGHTVLGEQATPDKPAPDADPAGKLRSGEQYIDHVSDAWIVANLPDELRMAVYQLPTDCADVAVMLRHVWLFAHGRTEKFGDWTIGVGAGKERETRAANLTRLARDKVYSGSVARIVAPYTDESGKQLLTFAELQHVLHPGDVLVWEHHESPSGHQRTGGHTQTISSIARDQAGDVTGIAALQGNQPIDQEQADEIRADEKQAGQKQDEAKTLRELPGRRIEIGRLSGKDEDDLPSDPPRNDKDGRWNWGDDQNTWLLAAGPASGAPRPKPKKAKGEKKALRKVSDWLPALKLATAASIRGIFEAALEEARAGVEGGIEQVTVEQATGLGRTAGARLHALRKKDGSVDALKSEMLAEMTALANAAVGEQAAQVKTLFDAVAQALADADPVAAGG